MRLWGQSTGFWGSQGINTAVTRIQSFWVARQRAVDGIDWSSGAARSCSYGLESSRRGLWSCPRVRGLSTPRWGEGKEPGGAGLKYPAVLPAFSMCSGPGMSPRAPMPSSALPALVCVERSPASEARCSGGLLWTRGSRSLPPSPRVAIAWHVNPAPSPVLAHSRLSISRCGLNKRMHECMNE